MAEEQNVAPSNRGFKIAKAPIRTSRATPENLK